MACSRALQLFYERRERVDRCIVAVWNKKNIPQQEEQRNKTNVTDDIHTIYIYINFKTYIDENSLKCIEKVHHLVQLLNEPCETVFPTIVSEVKSKLAISTIFMMFSIPNTL